eukprot:COSAG01_NODE_13735_length_1542_cov_6.726958_4_plen_91_part_01
MGISYLMSFVVPEGTRSVSFFTTCAVKQWVAGTSQHQPHCLVVTCRYTKSSSNMSCTLLHIAAAGLTIILTASSAWPGPGARARQSDGEPS